MPQKKKPVKIVLISNFNIASSKRKGNNAANDVTVIGEKRPRIEDITDDRSDSDGELLDPPRDLNRASSAINALPNRSDAPIRPVDQSRFIPPGKGDKNENDDSSHCSSSSSSTSEDEDNDDDENGGDGGPNGGDGRTPLILPMPLPSPSPSTPKTPLPRRQVYQDEIADPGIVSPKPVNPRANTPNKQNDQSLLPPRVSQITAEQPENPNSSPRTPVRRNKDTHDQPNVSPIAIDKSAIRRDLVQEKPFSDSGNARVVIPPYKPRVPPSPPASYRPSHRLPFSSNKYNPPNRPNRRPNVTHYDVVDPDETHIFDKNPSIGSEKPFMTLDEHEIPPMRNSTRIEKPGGINRGRRFDPDDECIPSAHSRGFAPRQNEISPIPVQNTPSPARSTRIKKPDDINRGRLSDQDGECISDTHTRGFAPRQNEISPIPERNTPPARSTINENPNIPRTPIVSPKPQFLVPQPNMLCEDERSPSSVIEGIIGYSVNNSPMSRSPGIANFQEHMVAPGSHVDSAHRSKQPPNKDLEDKFDGALLGLLVGDAIGRENVLTDGFPGMPELINDLVDLNARQTSDVTARLPLQGSYITGFCSAYARSLVRKRYPDPSGVMHELIALKCRPASDNMIQILNALQAMSTNAGSLIRDIYRPALNEGLRDSTNAASIVPLALFTINRTAEEETLTLAMLVAKLTQADYSSLFGVVLQCFALRKLLNSRTEDYSRDRSTFLHSFFEELIECSVLLEELFVSGQIFDGEYQLPEELEHYWNNEANKFKLEQLPQDRESYKIRLIELYEEMKKCENNNNYRIDRRIFCAKNYKTGNSTLDSVTLAILSFAIAANPKCNSEVSSKLGVNDASVHLKLIDRAYLYGISFGSDSRYVASMAAALAGALCGSRETVMPRLYLLCASYRDIINLSKQLYETVHAEN